MITHEMLYLLQQTISRVGKYPAYVAGGVLRDLRLGKPIKDIDVFIARDRDEDVYDAAEQRYYAKRIASALGAELRVTSESGYPDGEQVYATYEVDIAEGTVNLIYVSDIDDALNEFPDTLAQAVMEDDGTVRYSDRFLRSESLGIIETRLEYDSPRVVRLSQKFPEYVWVYVGELAPW